jgi:hypothetical protein
MHNDREYPPDLSSYVNASNEKMRLFEFVPKRYKDRQTLSIQSTFCTPDLEGIGKMQIIRIMVKRMIDQMTDSQLQELVSIYDFELPDPDRPKSSLTKITVHL